MDALQSIGVFAAQTFLILFAIIAVILVIAMVAAKAAGQKNEIEIELLHKKYKNFQNLLKAHTMSKTERKDLKKQFKQEKKESADKSRTHEKKIYVIDFEGDVKASAVENLREEVTAILT